MVTDRKSRFFALVRSLEGDASLGDVVEAYDADGDRMAAFVDAFDEGRGLVYLVPDWSTWIDGEDMSQTATAHYTHALRKSHDEIRRAVEG